MTLRQLSPWLTSGAAVALAACGGGGGGQATNFIPPPPATSTPTPAQVATGALAVPPAGVTSTTDFASTANDISIQWNADLKAYEISVSGNPSGKVVQTSFGPFGASGDVILADGTKAFSAFALTPFSYTGIAEVYNETSGFHRYFAFGVPTPAGSVPTVGSASYNAEIDGKAGGYLLYGNALLQFDFAAATLSGYMDPHTNGPFGGPALPRYTFTQTVFSPGSTTFSGSFDISGPTASSFSGQFTGPNAQELMARFTAPFRDPDAAGSPYEWGVMDGVMIGKRP